MASAWKPDLVLLERLAYQGLSDKQLSESFGVHLDVFNHFKAENMDMHDAVVSGRSRQIELVTRKFMDKIQDGNIHAIMFFLKTKGGWAESKEEDQSTTMKLPSGMKFSLAVGPKP